MKRKLFLQVLILALSIAVIIGFGVYYVYFNKVINSRKTLEDNANIKFSKLIDFEADVYEGGSLRGKLLYKCPDQYYAFNDNKDSWTLFDKDGVFWHYDINRVGAKRIYKVDTRKLNLAQKKKFYKQIPPFQESLYASLEGDPILQGKDDIIEGRVTAHFSGLRRTHVLVGIDFWVDKGTGIIIKYEEKSGAKWYLTNIHANIGLSDEDFVYTPPQDFEIYDGTFVFLTDEK